MRRKDGPQTGIQSILTYTGCMRQKQEADYRPNILNERGKYGTRKSLWGKASEAVICDQCGLRNATKTT